MRRALIALMLVAAPAAAQAPAEKEPPRQPLNLNLEDAMRSQSVIQFGPAPKGKEPEGGLPSLGSDARKMEAAPARSDSRTPYPKDGDSR